MEQTRNAPQILYTYRCLGAEMHRVYRATKDNNSPCSRCGKRMEMIASTTRLPDETESKFHVRAITAKKQSIN